MKIIPITLIAFLLATTSASALSTTYTNEYPANNRQQICPFNISLSIDISNTFGNYTNLTFYSNLSGSWDYFYTGTLYTTYYNITNGTYSIYIPFFSDYNTTYYWYVNTTVINSPSDYNQSTIFQFTTSDNISNCTTILTSSNVTDTISNESWLFGITFILTIPGFIAYTKVKKYKQRRFKKRKRYE